MSLVTEQITLWCLTETMVSLPLMKACWLCDQERAGLASNTFFECVDYLACFWRSCDEMEVSNLQGWEVKSFFFHLVFISSFFPPNR